MKKVFDAAMRNTIILFRHHLKKNKLIKDLYFLLISFFSVHKSYALNKKLKSPFSDIENRNKIIFVHVPKTAGNAVMKFLYSDAGTGHYFAREYEEFNIHKFNDYYKFAFVRNPWDRLVSSYFYLKSGGTGRFDKRFSEQYLSSVSDFPEFVRKLGSNQRYRERVMSWIHFRKQVDFLVNHSGKISMDFIGRFEDLDAGIRELSKALNVDPGLLEKVNSSTHKDFRKYYDSEIMNIESNLNRY